jgi:hypothetical protein
LDVQLGELETGRSELAVHAMARSHDEALGPMAGREHHHKPKTQCGAGDAKSQCG